MSTTHLSHHSVRQQHPLRRKVKLAGLLIVPLIALACSIPLRDAGAAPPSFVQLAYAVPQTSQKTVAAKYTRAQTLGNTNIVVVGWSDTTAVVTSLTDTRGNTYNLAAPMFSGNGLRQAIYFANNIVAASANTNTVTVTFNVSARFVDLRITEYSGLDKTNPLDKTAAATGTSFTAVTPSVATTYSSELIFAAGMSSNRFTSSGTGFTTRVITKPNANILFDRNVNTSGSYTASANQTGKWLLQVATFKAGPDSDTTPPTVPTALNATAVSPTQINLSWTASTDNVSVAGYKIFRNGTQVATSSGTSYQNTDLTQNTAYTYAVAAYDAAGNTSALSTSAGATTPPQSTNGPSLVEGFTQPDGDLMNNWSSTGSSPMVKVVSGKGSTLNSTLMSIAYKPHGVNVSGDWQIEFDVSAPLSIGHGGATVGLVNPADGSGYSVFIGNATHIQRYNPGGTHDNLTNSGRPGEGGGQLANHVVFTHTAAGLMRVYLDGVLWSEINDTQRVAGSLLFITLQNTDSPSFETTIDNLVVQDHIGN